MTTSGEAPQPRAVDSTNAQSESSHNLSNEPNQTEIDISAYQDICERNIKPSKLAALLRNRFGVGRYEVHVRPISTCKHSARSDLKLTETDR
ncbi:hypothetical protein N658DRAFT_47823 [Parathielavia hyrcaniae]|uniref:Uncharacterized protein n=1 Tax=Parathielavia hyrcaniae TaxID=113614 RepID=A0AAN6Q2E9_9PEZI|nr:hypothetical protein N658DRAFT_47823 [Parathielavia hyrcaniae]